MGNIYRTFRSAAVVIKGKGAVWPNFHRASLDERVNPTSQSRDVDINPIIPPVNGRRIITKSIPFISRKGGGK
jgi:hypothetical protein